MTNILRCLYFAWLWLQYAPAAQDQFEPPLTQPQRFEVHSGTHRAVWVEKVAHQALGTLVSCFDLFNAELGTDGDRSPRRWGKRKDYAFHYIASTRMTPGQW